MIGHYIRGVDCHTLALRMAQIVNNDDSLEQFRDITFFYNGIRMKSMFIANTYTKIYQKWQDKWTQEIDEQFSPRNYYFLNLRRQFAPGLSHTQFDTFQ